MAIWRELRRTTDGLNPGQLAIDLCPANASDGDDGLVASIRRASDAFGTLGRGAGSTTRELDKTLREVRDAAESIRVLTEAIERDPDMLLKGRAKAKSGGQEK